MIKIERTPERLALFRKLASKNQVEAMQAREALAAFIAPVAAKVINQAATNALLYTDLPFEEDSNPTIPVDLYMDKVEGEIEVWSQHIAGGLGTSQVGGFKEIPVTTYELDSAVSFLAKYARTNRLDVLAAAINRMIQEILIKQEINAWVPILKTAAEATTQSTSHVISATTADVFQLDDLNRLITLVDTINTSWAGGTAEGNSGELGLLLVSAKIMELIRGFAYQPMNTRSGAVTTSGATSVALPDSVRANMFNTAGAKELFGVNLIKINELGVGKKYDVLFDEYYSAAGGTFDAASDEVIIGVDLTRNALIRPVKTGADTSSTVETMPDDQFVARSGKLGFYSKLEEGRIVLDKRALVALKV